MLIFALFGGHTSANTLYHHSKLAKGNWNVPVLKIILGEKVDLPQTVQGSVAQSCTQNIKNSDRLITKAKSQLNYSRTKRIEQK